MSNLSFNLIALTILRVKRDKSTVAINIANEKKKRSRPKHVKKIITLKIAQDKNKVYIFNCISRTSPFKIGNIFEHRQSNSIIVSIGRSEGDDAFLVRNHDA